LPCCPASLLREGDLLGSLLVVCDRLVTQTVGELQAAAAAQGEGPDRHLRLHVSAVRRCISDLTAVLHHSCAAQQMVQRPELFR
jgi:hypothetical protein